MYVDPLNIQDLGGSNFASNCPHDSLEITRSDDTQTWYRCEKCGRTSREIKELQVEWSE